MSALYRMYRPQFFSEVIGQEQVKLPLKEALKSNRIVHSYLFSGPRGTGKTTMARIFAKALNCDNRNPETAEPCGKCESCLGITAGNFVDLIEIDAASNRGIDEIRNLKEIVRFAPSKKGRFKIFIIDEAHMLTAAASNALLKTLEEPPSHVIFIFATTDPHKMLTTILSRVQRFSFYSLTNDKLRSKIETILKAEKVEVDPEVIELLILQAMGGMRDAESILGKLLSLNISPITKDDAYRVLGKYPYFEVYDFLERLPQNSIGELVPYVQKLSLEYHPEQFLTMMMSQTRKILLYSYAPESLSHLELMESEVDYIKKIASLIPQEKILILIKLIEDAIDRSDTSFIPSLPLEILCLEFQNPTQIQQTTTPISQPVAVAAPIPTPAPTKPQYQNPSSEPVSTPQQSVPLSDPFEGIPLADSNPSPTPQISESTPSPSGGNDDIKMYMPILKGKIASKVRAILPMFEACEFTLSNSTVTLVASNRIAENRLKKHGDFLTQTFSSVMNQPLTLAFTHKGSSNPPSKAAPAPVASQSPKESTPVSPASTTPTKPLSQKKPSSEPATNTNSSAPVETTEVEDIFKEFL